MPYIKQSERDNLDEEISDLADAIKLSSPLDGFEGKLNYSVTKLMLLLYGEPSYKKINNMIGVLECIKQEMYRRYAVTYEDQKIITNGDVF